MTLQLATAALLLFSTLYGSAPAEVQSDAGARTDILKISPTAAVNQPVTLEGYVREYFADTPLLAEIAGCETRFRHLGRDGKVIRGALSQEDVGVMQINEFYHEERAENLGLNLHTLDGNLAYAKWLYNKEGTSPWFASSKCWQRVDALARANPPEADLSGLAKANTKTATN